MPDHKTWTPSVRTMVYSACGVFLYPAGTAPGTPPRGFAVCKRILRTSVGVTTRTASVIPEAKPAGLINDVRILFSHFGILCSTYQGLTFLKLELSHQVF